MNILFISLVDFKSIKERNIYTDLLREFRKHGHNICAISPVERRKKQKTRLIEEEGVRILKLCIGNTQKTNIIEKGISMVAIEPQFINAIKKYFSDVRFEMVLYPTPPITFCKAVEYVKKRDGSRSYLLLKDIFPQNAVDMGMMKKGGALYKYFRFKEKRLYGISDRIGCMSPANVRYVLKNNPEINSKKVEVCPNSIESVDMSITAKERVQIRHEYGIPLDRTVFIYGGNLGKPQGIGFMLKCLHSQRKNKNVFFLIVGNGTEYGRFERYIEKYKPGNIKLHQWLPREDYDKVVAACDVGMVFLDHRFTIPNFPSRLLGYMQCKLPVLAVTDRVTDIRKVVTGIDDNGVRTHEPLGWWCESGDVKCFKNIMRAVINADFKWMGVIGYEYMVDNYLSEKVYSTIMGAKYF